MPAAPPVTEPLFLAITTTEPNGEGELVRLAAERHETGGEVKTFERLVRVARLTVAQARLTGITNAQLDAAPDLDEALQDLIEFAGGAGAWIVAEASAARTALRAAAYRTGYPGLPAPIIGLDELSAVVNPTVSWRHRGMGVPPMPPLGATQHSGAKRENAESREPVFQMQQGAYLPHWRADNAIYNIVFRLGDSLPQEVLVQWKDERSEILRKQSRDELSPADEARLKSLFSEKVEKYLNAGYGECYLKQPAIAKIVADAIQFFDNDRYRLHAWCVMPNHVHLIIEPLKDQSLSKIIHSLKSFTAKEVNKALDRSGEIWQSEYFDHIIRTEDEYRHCVEYVFTNSDKAGLRDWPWRGSPDLRASLPLGGRGEASATPNGGHGRDAHATVETGDLEPAHIAAHWYALNQALLKLPLPLLAEMNWMLAKSEHPLKALLKRAEGEAVKNQFSDTFASGKVSLDKLFKDFSPIIDLLKPEEGDEDTLPETAPPEEPVTAQEIGALLGPKSQLAQGLDGYEERPEQMEMAQRVAAALNDGKHLMVEAGTGVGKSLAYLVPALLFAKRAGRPVMVSTHTKNLQSQLFEKDLPFLRQHLGVDFDASVLKGRPNYLCLRKFMYTLQESSHELDDDERAQMLPIMTWATQTESGDVSELAAYSREQNPMLWDRLHTVGDDCLKRQCPFYKRCFVYKARGLAHAADVVVLNHALVFSDLNLDQGALPAYNEIVFDEAHKLEDVATEHLGTEVTPRRIYKIFNRLFRASQGSSAGKGLLPTLLMHLEQARGEFTEPMLQSIRDHILAAMSAIDPANQGSEVFFDTVRDWLERPAPPEDETIQEYVPMERGREGFARAPLGRPGAKRKRSNDDERRRFSATTLRPDETEHLKGGKETVISSLSKLMHALDSLEEDFKEIRKKQVPRSRELGTEIAAQNMFLRELVSDIEFVIKGDEPNYVYWSERLGKRGARVVAAPLDVSALLYAQLYERKRSIVFASATLSVRDPEAGDASGLMPFRPQRAFKPAGLMRGSDLENSARPADSPASPLAKPHPKSFEFLKTRLGLALCAPEKLDELLLGSPFDYGAQCRLFVPSFLLEPGGPREKDFGAAFTAMLAELIAVSGGRAMVLYTSHAALQASATVLRKMLAPEGIEVLAQGVDGSREALLERLKGGKRSVLLGTASFWEGVDVRGEALSLLVINKLPFAVFTDPIVEGRCEMLESQGKDAFLHFSVPNAILKLRQGFGRLIRSKRDRGVVILADKRVLTKRYGAAFLRALPAQAAAISSQDALVQSVRQFLDKQP